jgi:major membrane immunogen (membrane-anchored lipoprotein)
MIQIFKNICIILTILILFIGCGKSDDSTSNSSNNNKMKWDSNNWDNSNWQ